MIQPLELHSERFPATGSIAAEGVQNQLGRPRLDRLAVLVREAVQNSWDAKRPGSTAADFTMSCASVSPHQREVLQNVLFAAKPQMLDLEQHLSADVLRILVVSDRGTVGLGGPTRADVAPDPGEPTDFVDFLRNVGQPPDHQYGGGTYGFGKAAFYLASRARTILVHTRCKRDNGCESRLIAAALGAQYVEGEGRDGVRYTGRHWWGRLKNGIAEPIVGIDADEIAASLGLPSFGEETGTTIVIIQPDFEGRDAYESLSALKAVLLRDFWPKWIDGDGGTPTMRFHLLFEGADIAVPHPEAVRELAGYVHAFKALSDAIAVDQIVLGGLVQDVWCQRPQQLVGRLALVRQPVVDRLGDDLPSTTREADADDPFFGNAHHAALLRTPNFVVRYLAGPAAASPNVEYAGVFRVDREVDRAFAQAEPPTHDDWVPDALPDGRDKTFVRVALRRLREILRSFSEPPTKQSPVAAELPLGAISDQLGGLALASTGTGARTSKEPEPERDRVRRSPTGRTRGGIAVVGEGMVELVSGRPALVVAFDAEPVPGESLGVAVEAAVVVEGSGLESEAPAGADRPSVLEWRNSEGRVAGSNAMIWIPPAGAGRWTVAVSIPTDAMISVSLRAVRAEAA